jgi:hypothetical protein
MVNLERWQETGTIANSEKVAAFYCRSLKYFVNKKEHHSECQ